MLPCRHVTGRLRRQLIRPHRPLSSCPTDQVVDDVMVELDGGGKMTLNGTGLEMSEPSPLVKFWVQSFDGIHPLLDVGCAYGRNVQTAHNLLKEKIDSNKTIILACDCNEGHLAAVNGLCLPGVETLFARLPDNFPPQSLGNKINNDGASGILMSEVLHFISGEAIEQTLVAARDVLVSDGVLAITACSPFMNFAPNESGVCHINSIIQPLYESNIDRRWPVGDGINLQTLLSGRHLDGRGDNAIKRMPTFFHPFSARDLRRAVEETGLRVISAEERWHPGYPPQYQNAGRENTQLLAVKI
mmetsp:Transcript_10423/g.20839  ORF Transcript_10423/g.20839 Transcript_10423/m.20839 type:complete len:301 (+) Transcript_10423:71-973(+)